MTQPADYDPFAEFDRAQGAGTVDDAYAIFAALRAKGPIVEVDPAFAGPAAFAGTNPTATFAAVSYDAVQEVLRDGARFSSAAYGKTMGLVMGHSILEMDEPEHARHRGVIAQAFQKRALERWERELVRPIVARRIEAFARRGRADLVAALTFPFPVEVICGMIGVPESLAADFHRFAVELISIQVDVARGFAASASLRELFADLLAERRTQPRDDLVSILAHAELDGARLDDEAIFAFLRLLAPAGAETTYRSSSNLLFALLSSPEQLGALRSDASLVDNAIDEGLRFECPLTGIARTATRDTTVCGVAIPADAAVLVNLGAANRDPAKFDEPDRFDIRRPNARQHLAFAFGPHRCLGQHLALMETRVLLEELFARCPNLRFDASVPRPHITGLMFRSPPSLPVAFDAN